MMLFSHLAFSFRWRTFVTAVLRIVSWTWTIFACSYIFYLTRVLYP
jgi:hypothetical protein